MAQMTGAISARAQKVEISTNGTVWTDISGFANSVEPDGGERALEEAFTFDGDTPILTTGKRAGLKIKTRIIYSEGVSDGQEVVRAAYEAASALYLRWSPKGGTTGQFQYTTSQGVVTSQVYPKGDASSAEAIATEFELVVASVTKAVAA
jgi:hypothetical protein